MQQQALTGFLCDSRDGFGYDAMFFSVLVWSFVVLFIYLFHLVLAFISSASQLIMVPYSIRDEGN